MDNQFGALTQPELLAVALEAARRGDAARGLTYLKEACARGDASPQAHFLLGSEYAQLSLIDMAFVHMERAIALAPEFAIARFQLGLLYLTSARAEQALATWAPLAMLGPENPLAVFRQGLEHLTRDEFAECIQCLQRGITLNTENVPLNVDMQRIIDRVRELPPGSAKPSALPAEENKGKPLSHLFLNAYTGGKVH